jgi:hypothetical protein
MIRIPADVLGFAVTRIDPAGYSWPSVLAGAEHDRHETTAS